MSESQELHTEMTDELADAANHTAAEETGKPETMAFTEDVLISEVIVSDEDLAMTVEALLLVSPEPPLITELAQACEVRPRRIEQALEILAQVTDRGWVVVRHGDRAHLASAPRYATQVRRFLGLERETRLSGPALEALAVIAYREPVTRSEIESVRGVDCSGVLATLHARGLIDIVGRMNTVGNPLQYATTPAFLHHFGLSSLADLPDLGAVNGTDAGVLLDAALAVAEEMPAPDAESGELPLETVEGDGDDSSVDASMTAEDDPSDASDDEDIDAEALEFAD